jgi:hypothetical protein
MRTTYTGPHMGPWPHVSTHAAQVHTRCSACHTVVTCCSRLPKQQTQAIQSPHMCLHIYLDAKYYLVVQPWLQCRLSAVRVAVAVACGTMHPSAQLARSVHTRFPAACRREGCWAAHPPAQTESGAYPQPAMW